MFTLSNVTQQYDGLAALDAVSATFHAGAVHGLLGENGAGKTTLMRVAAGLCTPDTGTVTLGERKIPPGSPRAAARAGIAMVHQHFMLVPTLTVAENCLIGRRDQGQWFSRGEVGRRIRQMGRHVGLEVDPDARIEDLSVGQQQRVEIVRALGQARRVLILDEPTAVLAPQETDQLFAAIDRLRRDGLAVILISHKLAEIERICDQVTILRRGRVVHAGPTKGLSQARMAELMVGQTWTPPQSRTAGEPPPEQDRPGTLVLTGVSAGDAVSHRRIDEVNLTVHAGEIVGVAGVEGNGQDVLAATIVGLLRPRAGRILLDGHDVTGASVRARAAAGLAHIAEDRLHQALVPGMSLTENLLLKAYRSDCFARAGLLRRRAARDYAAARLAEFDVRAGSPEDEARRLSGGNQQKVVLARELAGSPRLVLAHNPVRGLDVSATRFVFDQLLAQRRRGAALLLIHSDLDELLSLADRVAVLYNGRLTFTDWPRCPRSEIGRRMLGGT